MSNEDIKVLLEIKNYLKRFENANVLNKKYCQALENIIQENKELKEKAKNTMDLIGANYIHKNKVKEKIEWYEEACKHLSKNGIDLDKYDQYQGAIEALQELLEEGE